MMTEAAAQTWLRRHLVGPVGGQRADALAARLAQPLAALVNATVTVELTLAASPPTAPDVASALADLDEVRRAVFGDLGDEPDVYADHDHLTELERKMVAALATLRGQAADQVAGHPT